MTLTRAPGTRRPPRPQPSRSITLTGRGGVVALVAACFPSLLVAAWTGWLLLADVMFVMACGLVACYTRVAGLRAVVVCPPLAFCAGTVPAQLITAPDGFSAAEGILVMLGGSALWLFTGTALTFAIALGRGYRPQALGRLRDAIRRRLAGVRVPSAPSIGARGTRTPCSGPVNGDEW